MSAAAPTVTARCVHCAWRTDREDPDDLREVREIHELVHPGGTVLVGAEAPREPEATRSDPEPPGANGKRSQRPRGYWTRERIIEALQEFAREHGRAPLQLELRTPLPSNVVLMRSFGSMTAAIEAAGLTPAGRGSRGRGRSSAQPPSTPRPKEQPDPEPEPEPFIPSENEGTIAAFAQRVDELSTRRRAMLADLDAVEKRLYEAISECAAALDAERLEAS